MEGKNVILHIFMYNVISDFSAATPASEGRVKVFIVLNLHLPLFSSYLNKTYITVQDFVFRGDPLKVL